MLRVAILISLAASVWGQKVFPQPTLDFTSGQQLRAEDSPEIGSFNAVFYDNPRGLEPQPAPEPARTISVDQLKHPLSNKGARLLTKAFNFATKGLHDKAIEVLQLALKERSAVPYAHGMLGSEYLKMNQIPAAVGELEQAAAVLRHDAGVRSNLGYALLLSGNLDRAEQEARAALELDRNNVKTLRVLARIEAVKQLRREIRP